MATLPLMKTKPAKSRKVRIVKLRLDLIRLDAGTQTRAHIDDSIVLDYSEAMARDDRLPPVVVFQSENGDFILADGFHRVRAARHAKLGHILGEVRQGGRPDALRFALGANHKHGLRRTNGDKRRAVEIALAEFGNQSDRLLGQLCGISQTFVGNVRHQLSTVYSSPLRLGRDGKVRALPVPSNGGLPRPQAGVRDTSFRQDADGDPEAERETGSQFFMEVAEELAGVEERVEKLVLDHPAKTAGLRALIGKLRSDLLQLENRLRGREAQ